MTKKKGKCGDVAISHRTGKKIHGIAAMLQNMKDVGGPDLYRHNIGITAGDHAARTVLNELGISISKPKLKSVKWLQGGVYENRCLFI